MRLHAVADQHVIGLEGRPVKANIKAFGRPADDDGFGARSDGAADELFGDAVGFDEPALSLGRAAAVASHGRHNERLCAEARQMLDNRLGNDGDVGDSAAAGGDGHALAGPHFLAQVQPGKLRRTSPGTSSTRVESNVWRRRKILGKLVIQTASYHPEALLFKTPSVLVPTLCVGTRFFRRSASACPAAH